MDLTHPLRSLVPSLDSAALEVLSRTESGLGTTQIQRLAGRGSWAGHQKVLDRLVEHGLVLAEPTNKGFTYRLNREHLLTPAVLLAAGARRELRVRLSGAVSTLTQTLPVEHVSMFGSHTREQAHESSDIDLLVVLPDGYDDDAWQAARRQLEEQVLAWTGNRLEVLLLTLGQLLSPAVHQESVIVNLLEDGLHLFGSQLHELVSAVKAP